eukprot:4792_1
MFHTSYISQTMNYNLHYDLNGRFWFVLIQHMCQKLSVNSFKCHLNLNLHQVNLNSQSSSPPSRLYHSVLFMDMGFPNNSKIVAIIHLPSHHNVFSINIFWYSLCFCGVESLPIHLQYV